MLRNNKVAFCLFGLSLIASFIGSLTFQTDVHQHDHATFGHYHGNEYHCHPHSNHPVHAGESPFATYRRGKALNGKPEARNAANSQVATEGTTPHIHFVFLGFQFSWVLPKDTDLRQYAKSSNRVARSLLLNRKTNSTEVVLSSAVDGNFSAEFPWMVIDSNRIRFSVDAFDSLCGPCNEFLSENSVEPATPPPKAGCLHARV